MQRVIRFSVVLCAVALFFSLIPIPARALTLSDLLRSRIIRTVPPPPAPSPTPTPTPSPTPTPTPSPTPTPTPSPSPTPTPTPSPTPAPAQDYATLAEKELLRLTNIERGKVGVPALAADARLAVIARAHSEDMRVQNYFSHYDKNNCGPDCRLNKAGYAWRTYGENIFSSWGREQTPEAAAAQSITAWMQSSGHRANMLSATFTSVGFGLAKEGTKIWVTGLYATPR